MKLTRTLLQAEMTFTNQYPIEPPSFKFNANIYHPNVYPDGKICISILHAPGHDATSGEAPSERWSPLQGVESVLRSILLLLDDPEIGSPANVDASVMYRDNRVAYKKRAAETVARSKRDIPEGFVMPTTLIEAPPAKSFDDDDDAFWAESDDEFDFGGSSTNDDEQDMQEFVEEGEEENASEEGEEDKGDEENYSDAKKS
jgi:ubiquitin-conjugating enzyme E2 R